MRHALCTGNAKMLLETARSNRRGPPQEGPPQNPLMRCQPAGLSCRIMEVKEASLIEMGTEKERAFSSNDVDCCICLASYDNDGELKELPCSHLFHASCVDKWLKIKALCPLCKCGVGKEMKESSSAPNSG